MGLSGLSNLTPTNIYVFILMVKLFYAVGLSVRKRLMMLRFQLIFALPKFLR